MSAPPVPSRPPPSASSLAISGLGLAGLTAALLACAVLEPSPDMRPWICLLGTVLPMLAWAVFVERAHRDPASGLDVDAPRPPPAALRTTAVKLAGLWATWGAVAAAYWLLTAFHTPANLQTFRLAAWIAPAAVLLSVPYVLWVDRRMVEPRDELWEAGALVLGLPGPRDRARLADHARAWLVKGFFLVFMWAILPVAVVGVTSVDWPALLSDPARLGGWAIALMFTFDVCFGTVGYLCAVRALGLQIRSANPYLTGWVAALICYPPFILMQPGGPLDYQYGTAGERAWTHWLDGSPLLLALMGVALVFLTAVYAWATAAFGIRFSNLTHRGILTHGPYAWTKHPAYVSKNLFWWLAILPFLVTTGNPVDTIRNTVVMAIVSGVYYWRARTEERHLMADPAYREYAAWMERNAPLPKLIRKLRGGAATLPEPVPAE